MYTKLSRAFQAAPKDRDLRDKKDTNDSSNQSLLSLMSSSFCQPLMKPNPKSFIITKYLVRFHAPTHLESRGVPTSADFHANSPGDAKFAQLIQAARNGDQQALGELVQECRDYLLLIANQDLDQQLRSKLGGSDVVQESLLTAQASFDQFQGTSKTEFIAWIRQILKNDLLQTHRHYRQFEKRQIHRESTIDDSRQLGSDLRDQEHTPSTQAAMHEQSQLLENAMANLSAEYQQVIRLRNWDKLSYAEIGKRMGRSEEAARKLWGRAIVSLKNQMQSKP